MLTYTKQCLPSHLLTNKLYAIFISPMHTTYIDHLILSNLITAVFGGAQAYDKMLKQRQIKKAYE